MLSFLVSRPATRSADTAVLLFLHGVGEGFRNPMIAGLGVRNLFRQGVPKVLCDPDVTLATDHPLMAGSFTVVAPSCLTGIRRGTYRITSSRSSGPSTASRREIAEGCT